MHIKCLRPSDTSGKVCRILPSVENILILPGRRGIILLTLRLPCPVFLVPSVWQNMQEYPNSDIWGRLSPLSVEFGTKVNP